MALGRQRVAGSMVAIVLSGMWSPAIAVQIGSRHRLLAQLTGPTYSLELSAEEKEDIFDAIIGEGTFKQSVANTLATINQEEQAALFAAFFEQKLVFTGNHSRTFGLRECIILYYQTSETKRRSALQKMVGAHVEVQRDTPIEFDLDEDGYQWVASANCDALMKRYIRATMKANGLALKTPGEAELNGFAPWYSGTKAVQSYDVLVSDLQDQPWLKSIAEP